jgi:hypothetical protein
VRDLDAITDARIDQMLLTGELVEKLCFAYCGEDRCNCVGGRRVYIYQEELKRYKEDNEPQG